MFTREEILKSPEYWFEGEQNELYRQVSDYLEREKINQTELAKRLKISKGRVSQILDGEYNYSLKKLIEICLAIGLVPKIKYKSIEAVLSEDAEKTTKKNNESYLPTEAIVVSFSGYHINPKMSPETSTTIVKATNVANW